MDDERPTNASAVAFWYLASRPLSQEMVDHMVTATYSSGCCNLAANYQTATKPAFDGRRPPLLGVFIFRLARATRIDTGTLMCTAVCLGRLRKRRSQSVSHEQGPAHHVFRC